MRYSPRQVSLDRVKYQYRHRVTATFPLSRSRMACWTSTTLGILRSKAARMIKAPFHPLKLPLRDFTSKPKVSDVRRIRRLGTPVEANCCIMSIRSHLRRRAPGTCCTSENTWHQIFSQILRQDISCILHCRYSVLSKAYQLIILSVGSGMTVDSVHRNLNHSLAKTTKK